MLRSSSSPSSGAHSSSNVLRTLTARNRGIHPLLKVVRSTYRAQHRKPQFEPVCVDWIQRFLRTYPTTPVGRLDDEHVQSFLSSLSDRDEAARERSHAREALHFLKTEVLQHF